MIPNVKLLQFSVHGDSRGSLVALESNVEVPFDILRTYYIFGTQAGIPRGFHAHKTLRQILIAVSGSVTIHCEFKGQKYKFLLDSPDKGLLIEGLVWREMHNFSKGAVLLTLASEHYSEDDYIRDYNIFKQKEKYDTSSC
ncbi:MAG: FdtA/QdtA family cupin domain-containing protein [Desulfovibrionaceae bacterium]|nr:FdtA/QdtA family cupin domain-containing protein [Desulfovibrionaceae bacterium]